MEILVICIVSLLASGLTFFSGFGLGTILVPAFGLFFPIELAVALSAVVHFLNNIFKLIIIGKNFRKDIILSFGIPSFFASFAGAFLLGYLAKIPVLASYTLAGHTFFIEVVKLVIALIIIIFVFIEISPDSDFLQLKGRHLFTGGIISGFFGGLSGNQGALRTAFLSKAGLNKTEFIASGVVIACMVDTARLATYYNMMRNQLMPEDIMIILPATLSAFTGAYMGNKLLKKMTLDFFQKAVASFLFTFAILLGSGII